MAYCCFCCVGGGSCTGNNDTHHHHHHHRDGIQNRHEEALDCGGEHCPACQTAFVVVTLEITVTDEELMLGFEDVQSEVLERVRDMHEGLRVRWRVLWRQTGRQAGGQLGGSGWWDW